MSNVGTPIPQLEKATSVPDGTIFLAEMGDGSGTQTVTKETLMEETKKVLRIGDSEELQTENKESLVAAINEAAQSGGGGSVDILDSQEEIEANTSPEKVAGALAVKEMVGALNDKLGYETRLNPDDPTKPQWRPKGGGDGDWVNFTNAAVAIDCGNIVGNNAADKTLVIKSKVTNYQNLTKDNFMMEIVNANTQIASATSISSHIPTLSYNANTGTITVKNLGAGSSTTAIETITVRIWCFPYGLNKS